ncbi:hypothetical protein B296_00045775 [Ensete ventricosum]|uniref:Uncharacterized protein n=1 Tax=Ensete ventricosum TaxID=4639 RepID=A0A426XN43_ENSVE|nr:hypothetical protein B296_00045775 [Ensete ventricosum]
MRVPALRVVPGETVKDTIFNRPGTRESKEKRGIQRKRRLWSRKRENLMVLSVLMRIQWGIGLFWRIFFASFFLIRNVLCDG